MTILSEVVVPVTHITHEVATGLQHELAEMRLTGERGRRCTTTALAVALGTTLALSVHVEDVWWAAISAFVSSQATAPASLQRGILRILGTIAGAGFSLLLSHWIGADEVAVSLVLFAVSTAGVLGFLVSKYGYAWLLGAITADMVLMALLIDPLSVMDVGANRLAEVMIGSVSAMVVAVLAGSVADSQPAAGAPGWSDLLGEQWPAVEHALRAGLAILLVPLVWYWLDLPSLSQAAITVAAVMAVPSLSNDAAGQRVVAERAVHRLLGCLTGGVAGLVCIALSVESLLPWLLMLTTGIWISAHLQASERGISNVGTQAGVVFICTLMQGSGPAVSILPGIERFAGITGGLLILLAVSLLTAPNVEPTTATPTFRRFQPQPSHLK